MLRKNYKHVIFSAMTTTCLIQKFSIMVSILEFAYKAIAWNGYQSVIFHLLTFSSFVKPYPPPLENSIKMTVER